MDDQLKQQAAAEDDEAEAAAQDREAREAHEQQYVIVCCCCAATATSCSQAGLSTHGMLGVSLMCASSCAGTAPASPMISCAGPQHLQRSRVWFASTVLTGCADVTVAWSVLGFAGCGCSGQQS